MTEPTDHIARNRAAWNDWAVRFVAPGERNWATNEPNWGIWGVPETELHVLPDELDGLDAVELGCGTAYVSAWLARRGALARRHRQLVTRAARHGPPPAARVTGCRFPLHPGRAPNTAALRRRQLRLRPSPSTAPARGADPRRWVPEAARVLRPGGRLQSSSTNGTILRALPGRIRRSTPSPPIGSSCAGPTSACTASTWPGAARGRVPPGPRRLGPAAAPLAASRSRTCSRCGRPPTPSPSRPSTTSSPSSGRGAGPAKRSGRRASAPGGRRPSSGRAPRPRRGRASAALRAW